MDGLLVLVPFPFLSYKPNHFALLHTVAIQYYIPCVYCTPTYCFILPYGFTHGNRYIYPHTSSYNYMQSITCLSLNCTYMYVCSYTKPTLLHAFPVGPHHRYTARPHVLYGLYLHYHIWYLHVLYCYNQPHSYQSTLKLHFITYTQYMATIDHKANDFTPLL